MRAWLVIAVFVSLVGSGCSAQVLTAEPASVRFGGSPADSVLVGLLHILQGETPDIVISGANFGPNLGYASSSGTVGAATMAMHVGIPAIAVSVGIDPAEYSATPIPFPSTFGAFDGAAEFTVKLIRDLQDARERRCGLAVVVAATRHYYRPRWQYGCGRVTTQCDLGPTVSAQRKVMANLAHKPN